MGALDSYYRMRGIRRRQEEFDKVADDEAIRRSQEAEYREARQPVRLRGVEIEGAAQNRGEREATARHPNTMQSIRMKGREQDQAEALNTMRYPEELRETEHGINMRREARPEEVRVAEHGRELGAIERPETIREAKRKPAVNAAEHKTKISGEEVKQQENKYKQTFGDRRQADEEKFQNMQAYDEATQKALYGFAQTGNAKYLEDVYNDEGLFPDGQSVRIQPMGDGMYHFTHSNGVSQIVRKDELLQSTQEMFELHPDLEEYRQQRSGYGPSTSTVKQPGGIGGRSRGGGGKTSAFEREFDLVLNAISQLPENESLSDAELVMKAHTIASQKSGVGRREAIADFYQKQIDILMGIEPWQLQQLLQMEEEPTMRDIVAEAERLTKDYETKYYPDPAASRRGIEGGNKSDPGLKPGEDDRRTGQMGRQHKRSGPPTPTHIRQLLDNPNSRDHVVWFNRMYGEGMARKIIEEANSGEIL
jgi:hypothetical protein